MPFLLHSNLLADASIYDAVGGIWVALQQKMCAMPWIEPVMLEILNFLKVVRGVKAFFTTILRVSTHPPFLVEHPQPWQADDQLYKTTCLPFEWFLVRWVILMIEEDEMIIMIMRTDDDDDNDASYTSIHFFSNTPFSAACLTERQVPRPLTKKSKSQKGEVHTGNPKLGWLWARQATWSC